MQARKTVVIGFLGTQLDSSPPEIRWEKWRPTVSLCMQEDLRVDRLELFAETNYTKLVESVTADLGSVSPETQVKPVTLAIRDPWNFEEVYSALFDFARTYPFDLDAEDYLVHISTGTHVCQICLFLLTESRHIPARLIQTAPHKRGKPPGVYSIIDLNLARYDKIAARFLEEQHQHVAALKSGIVTRNAVFNGLMDELEHVARFTVAPILITGPTGAGKSQLARRIYELRKSCKKVSGRFVEVNCATLRGDGAMAALFGHCKGAFTGAVNERLGYLRSADQGMLFLDEIGELGLDEQAMLLRAIEEKRFYPLGLDHEVESNFQLLTGTNRDLHKAVQEGQFRADLLARINLWAFRLPGLAERPEDIEPNLEYELERFARESGTRIRFNTEAREYFLAFATTPPARWTGNFRDLNACVQRMATLSGGRRISREVVEREVSRLQAAWQNDLGNSDSAEQRGTQQLLSEVLGPEKAATLDRFDAVQLGEVLRVCRESRTLSEAGRTLFAVSRLERKTANDADRLRKYLVGYGLDWERVSNNEPRLIRIRNG